MAKILLLNPNKWGRGITTIWVASHASVLKKNKHDVSLFDCTFFKNWSDDELNINTKNLQFKPTNYEENIKWESKDLLKSLQNKIDFFSPDIIFSSAISSHIHGEGEYINIQHAYDLLKKMRFNGLIILGGLQSTSRPEIVLKSMPKVDYLISGESELILNDIAALHPDKNKIQTLDGINYLSLEKFKKNKSQKIINDLDILAPYDYSLFSDQTFNRPYNGKIIRAIDYEISRGCIYTCSYCVETIIQNYYQVGDNNNRGALKNPSAYLRNKSSKIIFNEIQELNKKFKIKLFRCQDTNFLTINKKVLTELADLIDESKIDIKLYIETRPEGINEKTVKLLKKLKVDGVGMGVELSDESFRDGTLNRYVDQKKIIRAFEILKDYKINRTAYNMIGLEGQSEDSIKETIKFNILLNPEVSSVAYYSAYDGTNLAYKSIKNYPTNLNDMDAQIRSKIIKHDKIDPRLLEFYKNNFNYFIENNMKNLDKMRSEWLENN
tara:strand:- start:763 stop:2247 length:1485 start_codon:yes stop_codon:yes gene_type:complete